jgi:hypothetical protein
VSGAVSHRDNATQRNATLLQWTEMRFIHGGRVGEMHKKNLT